MTDKPLVQLQLLIEVAKDGSNTYQSWQQYTISIDTLKSSQITIQAPFNLTNGIYEDQTNAGILSYKGKSNLLSGSYASVYAAFEDSLKINVQYGNAKGYILAGGESVFRLNKPGADYHIRGSFADSASFYNGILYNPQEGIVKLLSTDTLETAAKHIELADGYLRFRLKFPGHLSTTDTSKSILIDLKKE